MEAVSNPGKTLDYELLLDCVHCGLCTSACPTYVETGDENESPRGRIYLMRGVTDGKLELNDRVRGHLELCLDCRACETACPSGVQYGKLIEPFRVGMEQQAAASGKPANIIEKMVGGRIEKFYKEVTLVDQPWVRDDSKTIRDIVAAAGAGLKIRRFARFQMGQE